MASSKAFIAFLITITSLLYLSDAAADLVAPNSLRDGEYLDNGVWTFLNEACTLKIKVNGVVIFQSQSSLQGICSLKMRADGELVQTRDTDGEPSYASNTASVLGEVLDSYRLHLGSDGHVAIERSDGSVIFDIDPASFSFSPYLP